MKGKLSTVQPCADFWPHLGKHQPALRLVTAAPDYVTSLASLDQTYDLGVGSLLESLALAGTAHATPLSELLHLLSTWRLGWFPWCLGLVGSRGKPRAQQHRVPGGTRGPSPACLAWHGVTSCIKLAISAILTTLPGDTELFGKGIISCLQTFRVLRKGPGL
jgi:hypothetical protein